MEGDKEITAATVTAADRPAIVSPIFECAVNIIQTPRRFFSFSVLLCSLVINMGDYGTGFVLVPVASPATEGPGRAINY